MTNQPDIPFSVHFAQGIDDSQRIATLVNAGYTPESVVEAVESRDWSKLVHSGLYPVVLQPPSPGGSPTLER